MTLEARIHVERGDFALDVELAVGTDEILAVLGPNGAGKTSLLRALAGLEPLQSGRIVLDGAILDDPAAGAWRPPERRPIGVVFQDYLLFPHLSVRENVAFGLRCRGVGRRVAGARADEWLDRLELRARATDRPATLSGGEAQRVALARALAVDPRLLLLDEPLAALDVQARGATRRMLCRHLAAFSGVRLVVTHDPLEAMTLGDRLLVIEHGRVVQEGSPAAVAAHPRSAWVADLVGVNLLEGDAVGETVLLAGGGRLTVAGTVRGPVLLVIHPRAIALHRARPDGSPRNAFAGMVEDLDDRGDRVRVRVAGTIPIVAEVTPAAVTELALVPGAPVWVTIKATEITWHPA